MKIKTWFTKLLLYWAALLAPPKMLDELRRQQAKTAIYKAFGELPRAEVLSILSEVISENSYRGADMDLVREHSVVISDLANRMDTSSFLLLLSQGLFAFIEQRLIPQIKPEALEDVR